MQIFDVNTNVWIFEHRSVSNRCVPKYKNIQFCAIRNVENLNKQNNLFVKKKITKYVKLMYENIRYKY